MSLELAGFYSLLHDVTCSREGWLPYDIAIVATAVGHRTRKRTKRLLEDLINLGHAQIENNEVVLARLVRHFQERDNRSTAASKSTRNSASGSKSWENNAKNFQKKAEKSEQNQQRQMHEHFDQSPEVRVQKSTEGAQTPSVDFPDAVATAAKIQDRSLLEFDCYPTDAKRDARRKEWEKEKSKSTSDERKLISRTLQQGLYDSDDARK
ncbi:MAG: hypothetical protein ABL901_15885 [Hyphomicrobiaceae bacterium]|nr:hypothetical protein [Hyphomicrobiaceae bacterium]